MMLGYYLFRNGNIDYIRSVSVGTKEKGDDVHTKTQMMTGLPSRNAAKTFSYATLYGSGALKIGMSVFNENVKFVYNNEDYQRVSKSLKSKCDKNGMFPIDSNTYIPFEEEFIVKQLYGELVKSKFLSGTEGLKDLMLILESSVKENGYITSLDGRRIHCDMPHKALNYLLQSSGAIFMKYYLLDTYKHISTKLRLQIDYAYICNIHDALIIETTPNHVDFICNELRESFKRTSIYFGFPEPYFVKGEPIVGKDYYEIF